MHLSFVIPPEPLRIGGLDKAIFTLKDALESDGSMRVTCDERQIHPKADIAHFHGLWMPQHLRAYHHCQRHAIPYVVSPHGMLEPWAFRSKQWKKRPYLRWVDAPNLRGSQSIFVTSPIEKRNMRALTQCEQIAELPLGMADQIGLHRDEARDHFGLEEDDRILLYLSRIDPKKGLDLLIEALEDTPYGRWQLWIVGDGPAKWVDDLKAYAAAKRRRLPPIHWFGAQWDDAKWPYLAAADLFCLPTHSENFGLAVLESLWVGTPVLTTPQTPWADHAQIPGITIGENDVGTLKTSLTNAFTDHRWSSEQRQQLQSWSQQHYHWNQLRQRYHQAYETILRSAK